MKNEKSKRLFEMAEKVAPSGVHSDFRHSFPHFFQSAEGSKITDVDGNTFIDYHMAFGPLLLGHRNQKVISAVRDQLDRGDLWGMGSHELELDVAEKIAKYVPSAEKVRFCNSGTEATYHALRLARAYSRKRKVVKFEGSYHGWHDYFDIGVFPPREKLGLSFPNSSGMLDEATKFTIVLPYNDVETFERAIERNRDDLAAVIVEPILHSCGCIMPKQGFLETLREYTDLNNVVLIFDEVITGFRHSLGGAQKIFGVTPNLTIFAKAMANGFPTAAVCGQNEIMDQIEPRGRVHVAGTYSGHPVSMAAAKATIQQLEDGSVHDYLSRSGEFIRTELGKIIEEDRIPAKLAGFKSIFTIYFSDQSIENFADLRSSVDEKLFEIYCNKMHENGIFIPPQSFKRCHISYAHSQADLRQTIESARLALDHCRKLEIEKQASPT